MDKLREVFSSSTLHMKKIDLNKYCHSYIPQSCHQMNQNIFTNIVFNMLKLEKYQNVIKYQSCI